MDQNMSASHVGGRNHRNLRNHLFIVYGIINSVVQKETGPVDIAIYDIAQCFDSMWLSEVMNNIYDVLPKERRDDKLSLIYENNKKCELAINTPFGLTERKTVTNTVQQGSSWGPIMYSVQIDNIGKECPKRGIHLFKYKNYVNVMPLSMVDDLLTITNCHVVKINVNKYMLVIQKGGVQF